MQKKKKIRVITNSRYNNEFSFLLHIRYFYMLLSTYHFRESTTISLIKKKNSYQFHPKKIFHAK